MENAKPAGGRYRSGNGRECICLVGERLVFVQYADGSYNAFMLAANMANTLVMPPVGECDTTPGAILVRNAFAGHIHAEAPPSVFGAFVAACRKPSADGIRGAYAALSGWLGDRPEGDVAEGLAHSVADSAEFFEELGPDRESTWRMFLPLPDDNKRGQPVWMLPNLTSLTNIYARVNLRHRRRVGGVTLLHDRQDHFDDILRASKSGAERLAVAGQTMEVPHADYMFEEQAALTFVDSSSPGVRAADLLAGFVMRYVRTVLYGGAPPTSEYTNVYHRLLLLSEPAEGLGVNLVLSPDDRMKVHALLPPPPFLVRMTFE
ncbi:MAG: hypothetical protein H7Z12_15015 [Rhodospirillaceae bacterium]|nr:hypothetical protein [Rhodospirillales bacterium]